MPGAAQLPMQVQSLGRCSPGSALATPSSIPKSSQPLGNVVMQLSRDPAALLLLGRHHLVGKIAEFFLGPFLFGDIARRGAEPGRATVGGAIFQCSHRQPPSLVRYRFSKSTTEWPSDKSPERRFRQNLIVRVHELQEWPGAELFRCAAQQFHHRLVDAPEVSSSDPGCTNGSRDRCNKPPLCCQKPPGPRGKLTDCDGDEQERRQRDTRCSGFAMPNPRGGKINSRNPMPPSMAPVRASARSPYARKTKTASSISSATVAWST